MADTVPGSREELLEHLDQLAGRSIRTRAELEAYLDELKARPERAHRKSRDRHWAVAKQVLLGIGLLMAVLQYYLIDVYVQILSLRHMQVFNPVGTAIRHSALQLLSLFC